MNEVAVREATKAVETDYANYSAHLFLANSYNALRDPQQVNLRYETAWLSEYLVANLLSPVGAGTLSPMVSQEEYSRLFEQNRLGLASLTEYSTRGNWGQSAVQYGQFNNWGYAVEETYRSQNGDRPNDDLRQLTLSLRLKQQLTPHDSVYLQTIYYNAEAGDLAPYYDPSFANLTLRVKETQEPLLVAGYHHEWSPGVHTLVLAGRLQDTVDVTTANAGTLFLESDPLHAELALYQQKYRNRQTIYVSEIQQLFEVGTHTFILGGRYQTGNFKVANEMSNGATYPAENAIGGDPIEQNISADFQRFGFYGYDEWRPIDSLMLVGGISYDSVSFPVNYLFAPVSEGEARRDRIGPKAGLVWTPTSNTTVRAGYSRALGGVSFDQSFRLEPSQVAGFNQAFRSLIPEAVAGSVAAPRFDIYGVQLEQFFPTRTYLGLTVGLLQSDADRTVGGVEFNTVLGVPTSNAFQPTATRQSLSYDERGLAITLNQLIGEEFAVGVGYQVSRARLKNSYPDLPATTEISSPFALSQAQQATLQQVRIYAVFNHPSGFFCGTEGLWNGQDNAGYSPGLPGDDFWQLNLYGGYRWWRRHAELRLALLNVTDQDYHLNPLNLTALLPRQRTMTVSLRLSF
jgi:TonB-dependent receptor-like protein